MPRNEHPLHVKLVIFSDEGQGVLLDDAANRVSRVLSLHTMPTDIMAIHASLVPVYRCVVCAVFWGGRYVGHVGVHGKLDVKCGGHPKRYRAGVDAFFSRARKASLQAQCTPPLPLADFSSAVFLSTQSAEANPG